MAGCQKNSDNPSSVNPYPELSIDTSEKQIIITEQASASVRIYDQPTRLLLWSWQASDSQVTSNRSSWFSLPSEAKPLKDASCLLVTASGGGAAIIRISDRKVLFCAAPKGNPHGGEILPDGNVAISSSDGYISIYPYDEDSPFMSSYLNRFSLDGAHSVLWDKKRSCLWAVGTSMLVSYSYESASLSVLKSFFLPSSYGHDLVPVYGEDNLMITTGSGVYTFDPNTEAFKAVEGARNVSNVKSVSTGPSGFTTICTIPTESWYTPEVLGLYTGLRAFFLQDAHIYKARWRVGNEFSY